MRGVWFAAWHGLCFCVGLTIAAALTNDWEMGYAGTLVVGGVGVMLGVWQGVRWAER